MKVTTQRLAVPMLVLVTYEYDELKEQLDEEWKKKSKTINLKGFRAGNVPRKIAEQRFGVDHLYSDTLTESMNKALDDVKEDIVYVDTINIVTFEHNKPIVLRTTVDLKPTVIVKNDTIEIEVPEIVIKEEDIQNKMLAELDKNTISTKSEDSIKNGDEVSLTVALLSDGKLFNPKEPKQNITGVIGELHPFGFIEDILLGKKINDKLDEVVSVGDHPSDKMANKDVTIRGNIQRVIHRDVPEVNDEFAKKIGFENVKQWKQQLEKEVFQDRMAQREHVISISLLNRMIEENEIGPLPDGLVSNQIDALLENYAKAINLPVDQYLKKMKTTKESFSQVNASQAYSRIQSRLLLEAVHEQQKFEVTEEDIDNLLKKQADNIGKTVEEIDHSANRKKARLDVGTDKALEYLKSRVIIKEVKEEKK